MTHNTRIVILATGGTFDKEYNEITGKLFFNDSHIREMLDLGRCKLEVDIKKIMLKDSLDMKKIDRKLILDACLKTSTSKLVITHGTDTMSETAKLLSENGIGVKPIFKVGEGRPHVVDAIKNGEVQLVINTPLGAQSRSDEYEIGRSAIRYKVPAITTISGAQAAVRGIRNIKSGSIQYRSLQEVFT